MSSQHSNRILRNIFNVINKFYPFFLQIIYYPFIMHKLPIHIGFFFIF